MTTALLKLMALAATVAAVAYTPAPVPYETPAEIAEEEFYDSLELAALCVEAEAGNQCLESRRAVAATILNRVESPDWPDTIPEVIAQYGQYATYSNGEIAALWEPSEDSYAAVRLELEERSYPDFYYFNNDDYNSYGSPVCRIGDLYFSGEDE